VRRIAATDEQNEPEALRARVAALEAENFEIAARANRQIAAVQDRMYWLDRWGLDLNALMRRPGAAELRAATRAARAVYRRLVLLKRRLAR
jgi:hypothetical protein